MLLVLSPNLCIDRVVVVPDFTPGRVHRARAVHILASGKGMNVARTARALGVEATVVGVVGDDAAGRWFVTDARRQGMAVRTVRGRGTTRTCTLIVAPGQGETVVNEPGPQADARTADLLRRRVHRLLGQASVLVLTGSLPPGLPATCYGDVIAEAAARPTVLDASGAALQQGVAASPTVLKVNREELAARVREARAQLQAAQAAEQAALATLERNQVEAEGPDLPFLKASWERARDLYEDGLIAKSTLEDAEKNYQLALNRQQAALRNLGVSRAEVARARAQVAQAQAALERAEEDLRNATITSPMDGLVLSRDVEVGDAVSSILVLGSQATLVMTLGDVRDVYVLGKVDESDIGKVYLGQPARIVVESFKDRTFTGQVTKISPLGVEKDNVTTFEVRVSIHNPGGELKANMTANAEIILEERKGVLLVPESAVLYDRERNTFLEVPDPKAEQGRRRVAVKLGISNGVKTELLEGLAEGQRVILQ